MEDGERRLAEGLILQEGFQRAQSGRPQARDLEGMAFLSLERPEAAPHPWLQAWRQEGGLVLSLLVAGCTTLQNLRKGIWWALYTVGSGCGPFKALGPGAPELRLSWGW